MEDLQGLLEKINRDGVEKAEAEARRIVEAAQAKADEIVRAAQAAAEKTRSVAQADAESYAVRAAETVRQAARDVVLGVKDSVSALFEQLLTQDVDKALSDEKATAALVAETIKGISGPGEIVCGTKLASALKAQLATLGSFTIVTDDTLGGGFAVKTDGGRVEHAFTVETIAAELAKRLRPDLASLLK